MPSQVLWRPLEAVHRGWELVHRGLSRGHFARMLINIKDTPKARQAGLPLDAHRSTLTTWRWSDLLDQIGARMKLSGART
jgi:hypothetical protein